MTVPTPLHSTSEAYRKADYVSIQYMDGWASNHFDHVTLLMLSLY